MATVFSEPSTCNGKSDDGSVTLKDRMDGYIHTHVPAYVSDKVDRIVENATEKRESIASSVLQKINSVFDVCERIVDHYIPDEKCDREGMNDMGIMERMNALSSDVTSRLCHRFLPFLKVETNTFAEGEEKEETPKKLGKVRPLTDAVVDAVSEPLKQAKEACVECAKPVVNPLMPIITPIVSLVVLLFLFTIHIYYTIFIAPIRYIWNKGKTFYGCVKKNVEVDEHGERPIVHHATEAYTAVKDEFLDIFIDQEGKITMKKFQELCKEKSVEYKELIEKNVTAENLSAFLNKKSQDVKDVVTETMKPFNEMKTEAEKHYKGIVELLTDKDGHFSLYKIQEMVGESGIELKKAVKTGEEKMKSGKEVMQNKAQEVKEKASNAVASTVTNLENRALSLVSVVAGVILLFPTICLLLTVFVLSYFIDIEKISPSPAMKRIISAMDTVEVKRSTEGSKTTVTIKYNDPLQSEDKPEEKKEEKYEDVAENTSEDENL